MIRPNAVINISRRLVTSIDRKYIEMDEEIFGGFKGSIPKSMWDGKSMKHGVLVITTKRVIMWDRKLLGDDVESYYYPNIRSVQFSRGIFSSHITLNMSGKNKKFQDMSKNDAKIATDMINHQISISNSAQYQPILPIQQAEDPFTILDNRLAAGQMSIEEYQSTKRALQGNVSQSNDKNCPNCGTIISKQTMYCLECGFHLK